MNRQANQKSFCIFAVIIADTMANDWKDRLGVVFSTDPDFKYVTTADLEEEADTLPAASQKLTVSIDRRSRGGKQVTIVKGFVGTTAALA